MEQVLDWLNENELRAYPLLDNSEKILRKNTEDWWVLPDNFILDLQLITTYKLTNENRPLSKINTYLSKISYSSGSVFVHFNLHGIDPSSENEVDLEITFFEIPLASQKQYPVYLRNPDGCLAVFGEGVLAFIAKCGGLNTIVTSNISTEPALYTQFDGPWLGVNSISAAPEKVSKPNSFQPKTPLEAVQSNALLIGDVQFLAGYNFRVDISNDNLIDLEINASYGLKMDCATSFIDPKYLDCSEFVCFINGLPPDDNGNFRINAGTNISITSGNVLPSFYDPFAAETLSEESNQHTLFVGLNFKLTDVCAPINVTPYI